MSNKAYNVGIWQNESPSYSQPLYKRVLNKIVNIFNRIKSFAKRRPYIFGAICLGILIFLIILIVIIAVAVKNSKDVCHNKYSDKCLYEKMISQQSKYPEGYPWTNDNYYEWKGGVYGAGRGCAAFAFMLSDVCFGEIKATQLSPCPSSYKVGDVVRVDSDARSVIILKIDKKTNKIILAEGNFAGSVHWGREITNQELKNTCNHVLRRNPK